VKQEADNYVQTLNDRFTNPSGQDLDLASAQHAPAENTPAESSAMDTEEMEKAITEPARETSEPTESAEQGEKATT
jgi:hypothetical protein